MRFEEVTIENIGRYFRSVETDNILTLLSHNNENSISSISVGSGECIWLFRKIVMDEFWEKIWQSINSCSTILGWDIDEIRCLPIFSGISLDCVCSVSDIQPLVDFPSLYYSFEEREQRMGRIYSLRGEKWDNVPMSLFTSYIVEKHEYMKSIYQQMGNIDLTIYQKMMNLVHRPKNSKIPYSIHPVCIYPYKFEKENSSFWQTITDNHAENCSSLDIYPSYNCLRVRTGRIYDDSPFSFNTLNKNSLVWGSMGPPNEGSHIIFLDWNSMEWRLAMQLAGDTNNEDDHHEKVAQKLNISREEAKKKNYALLYGKNLTREASPVLFDFFHKTQQNAKKKGYGQSLFGRRKRLRDEADIDKLFNFIVQASAADIINSCIYKIYKFVERESFRSYLSLFIYDKLYFVYLPGEKKFIDEVIHLMKHPLNELVFKVNCSESNTYCFHDKKTIVR